MENTIIELDVRDDINNKREPFQKIMDAISGLQKNDVFILHAPIKPIPLFAVMKGKGFTYEAEKLNEKHWKIVFTKQEA